MLWIQHEHTGVGRRGTSETTATPRHGCHRKSGVVEEVPVATGTIINRHTGKSLSSWIFFRDTIIMQTKENTGSYKQMRGLNSSLHSIDMITIDRVGQKK